MIKSTPLPLQIVQAAELASFTTALSGALSLGARAAISTPVPVAAGKAILVSCESVEAAQFVIETSKDGGAAWQCLESLHAPDPSRRLVRCLTTDGEAFQVRLTVIAQAFALTAYRAAYQLRG